MHAVNVFIARIEEEIFPGAIDQLRLVTENGTQRRAPAVNESAMQQAIREGDRVYGGSQIDEIVNVPAE